MSCKGLCERFESGRRVRARGYVMGDGIVYCAECMVYFPYEGKRCPCCATKLRLRTKKKYGRRAGVEVPRL